MTRGRKGSGSAVLLLPMLSSLSAHGGDSRTGRVPPIPDTATEPRATMKDIKTAPKPHSRSVRGIVGEAGVVERGSSRVVEDRRFRLGCPPLVHGLDGVDEGVCGQGSDGIRQSQWMVISGMARMEKNLRRCCNIALS